MSCGGKINTCGKISPAKCIKYEGNIAEHGDLISCDCHSIEEVVEDLSAMADEAYEQTHYPLNADCLQLLKDKEGNVENAAAVQAIATKLCEVAEAIGLSNTGSECEECIDPCSTGNDCCGGVVYTNYTSGEIFVSDVMMPNWTIVTTSQYNMEYKVQKSGNYKVTLDVGCTEEDPNGRCKIGIGVNSSDPEAGNPFAEHELIPEFNSKTLHFFLRSLKKGDIMKLKFKGEAQTVLIDGLKMIIEKA